MAVCWHQGLFRCSPAIENLPPLVRIDSIAPNEDLFQYVQRQKGHLDRTLCQQILGAANEFKEGDAILGVAASDDQSRRLARQLIENTRIASIDEHPTWQDELFALINQARESAPLATWQNQTLGQLRAFLLEATEAEIHAMKGALSSDVIACVTKLMSNDELIRIGAKIFNPLPGSNIGARGHAPTRQAQGGHGNGKHTVHLHR